MRKIAVLGLILVFSFAMISFAGNDLKYEIGKKVTDLKLPRLDGKEFDLDKTLEEKDIKGVALVFISYICPSSIASDARYKKHAADFQKKGIVFVGINANMATENKAAMTASAKKLEYNFPVLWDEGNVIADRFDAKKTPQAFFIDKDAILRYSGRVDDNANNAASVKEHTLEMVIGQYLDGKEITTPTTRPQG